MSNIILHYLVSASPWMIFHVKINDSVLLPLLLTIAEVNNAK